MTYSSSSNFALDYYKLFDDVAIIAKGFPGWTLRDIKSLTVRERRYWVKLVLALAERKSS